MKSHARRRCDPRSYQNGQPFLVAIAYIRFIRTHIKAPRQPRVSLLAVVSVGVSMSQLVGTSEQVSLLLVSCLTG
jgi:hypothetical protein